MSKTLNDARNFLKKSTQTENGFVEGFQSVSSINIPAISIPITIELSEQEKLGIHKILSEDYSPDNLAKNQIAQHVEQLTNITKQIKSIAAQSVLLHGERIKQAQDLLSNYREGAFSKWLMCTYGNRQSPYNMLRYYELYQNAPKDAQQMIESAPKKCVYVLASREGDDKTKLNLIQSHGDKPQAKFLHEIQQAFPITEIVKRKPLHTSTIESISKLCTKLESGSKYITDADRQDIEKLIQRLKNLQ